MANKTVTKNKKKPIKNAAVKREPPKFKPKYQGYPDRSRVEFRNPLEIQRQKDEAEVLKRVEEHKAGSKAQSGDTSRRSAGRQVNSRQPVQKSRSRNPREAAPRKAAPSNIAKPKKRRLTEAEIADIKYRRELAAARKREKSRILREKLMAGSVLFLTVYFILIGLIIAFLYINFQNSTPQAQKYSLLIYDENKNRKRLTADQVYVGGDLYIPVSYLAYTYKFSVVGDDNKITLLSGNTEDTVICGINSRMIEINDTGHQLTKPILFRENDYLLPIEFFELFEGFSFEYDEKTMVLTIALEKNAKVIPNYAKITPIPPIPADTSGVVTENTEQSEESPQNGE